MAQKTEQVGFIGLGVMGKPMALNLLNSGVPLIVWNRSPHAREALHDAGASVATDVEAVFAHTQIVICMLVNEAALDAVLQRGTSGFGSLVKDHVIVSMGSNSPSYSQSLAADISAAGGRYVEAPVSGSRKPAETGQLVCLSGGDADTISEIRPLLTPMCRETVLCGPVGNALLMKLTVNLYLNAMLAAMAEAVHFADRHGLDLDTFKTAIDSGPMSCDFVHTKLPKLITRDFSVQAATEDGLQQYPVDRDGCACRRYCNSYARSCQRSLWRKCCARKRAGGYDVRAAVDRDAHRRTFQRSNAAWNPLVTVVGSERTGRKPWI